MAYLKEQIDLASLDATLDIVPKGTKLDSYIGNNVINLPNTPLTQHQVSALDKELPSALRLVHQTNIKSGMTLRNSIGVGINAVFNTNSQADGLNISQCITDFLNKMLVQLLLILHVSQKGLLGNFSELEELAPKMKPSSLMKLA